jgi:hypothetical protein
MPTLVTFKGTDDADIIFVASVILLDVDACFAVSELAEPVEVDV